MIKFKANKLLNSSIGLIGLVLILTMPKDAPGQYKWFIVACLSSFLMARAIVYPKLGIGAALLFGYVVINASWFWIWRENRYLPVQPYDQMGIRFFASDGLAKLLLVCAPLFVALQDPADLGRWGKPAAAIFCLLGTLMVYFSALAEPGFCSARNSCGGALSNPSMNASLIVCALPFLLDYVGGWKRIIALLLVAGAIFLSKSSIGVGLLALLIFLYACQHRRVWAVFALPAILTAGYLLLGADLLSSNGRVYMWEFFMNKWAANPLNYPFGTGYGTFGIFSANLQQAFKVTEEAWWIWMHNDWLEILFTLGVTGLVLAAFTYFEALKKLFYRKEYTALISAILYGIVMGLNYPLHAPISALFGAWLFLYALQNREPDNKIAFPKSWSES